jgi:hypothetical protein
MKKLSPVHTVILDPHLSPGRGDPLDEALAAGSIHMRVLFGIDRDDGVRIDQQRIVFENYR